ncbi:MAG: hypothetical protein JNM70_17220 [Anaerolineae bacterium]|nr:hypothetical protein [Anaerolineae bacterium]
MRKLLILMAALLMAGTVWAHDPSLEEEDWGGFDAAVVLPDASISYALYGYLDEEDIDVFRLDFEAADALLRAEVLTPVCGEHYADFYPQMVVLGPATEGIEGLAVDLPFDVPEGLVVYVSTWEPTESVEAEATPEASAARPTFVEPFGGTAFYEAPRFDFQTPMAGSYYVVVFNADAMTGDYTLATGYREVFNSPADQVMSAVQAIRSGDWLHRRCDLPPGDPEAIIEHDHEHESESKGE